MKQNSNTKSNFGKWGWSMIIYCALSYYIAAALSTDTLNYYPSVFSALRGWGSEAVNTMNTMVGIGGWVGIIGAVVFSIVAMKIGSKWTAVIGNCLTGIFCFIFAFTQNFGVFCAMIILMIVVGGAVQVSVVPNNLMNVWFPKKKGLALGWASMGLPLCTATIILIMDLFVNKSGPQGISTFYMVFGIVNFIFAGVSIFWVKNTPEEVGCTPDNETVDMSVAQQHLAHDEEAAKSLTTKTLLKNRNTWLIGFGLGFMWMTTLGLVSNFIPRLSMTGIDAAVAIKLLTVAAIAGIIGSYIWGLIDQKFTTKIACIIYGIWYLVALLLMIFMNGTMPMAIIAAVVVGIGIGGIGNLIPSMIGTCFGRFGFLPANKVITPINTAVRCMAFIIIGAFGLVNLASAYWVFFALNIVAIIMMFFVKIPNRESK